MSEAKPEDVDACPLCCEYCCREVELVDCSQCNLKVCGECARGEKGDDYHCVGCGDLLCIECLVFCHDCPFDGYRCSSCNTAGIRYLNCQHHYWQTCGNHTTGTFTYNCETCRAEYVRPH